VAARFPLCDVRLAAASDENGEATFTHVRDLPGYSGFHAHPHAHDLAQETITVRTERIDDVLPADYVPALIKIDVEGAELQVLRGALRTLKKHRPILVFEHGGASFQYGTTPGQVYGLLCGDAGYSIFDPDGGGPYDLRSFVDAAWHGRFWNWIARAEPASQVVEPSILRDDAPWRSVDLPYLDVPGMIKGEEAQYYRWVGQYFSGAGEAVELGPWLGCSTFHILGGLDGSTAFAGRKLFVYDDFVWRPAWMDQYYDWPDRPGNHEDFRPIFDAYTRSIADRLVVEKGSTRTRRGGGSSSRTSSPAGRS
jgi:hypothetical protein